MNYEELIESLNELRLSGIKREYAELARIAEKEKTSYEQYLFVLLQTELKSRLDAKVKRLILNAKIPKEKDLATYDFKRVKGITAQEIGRLATGQFIKSAHNLIFYGDIGVGKTHLAIGLIKELCCRKFHCLFTSTSLLIESLLEAKKKLCLAQSWKKLDKYDLIVCDELGYIPQTKDGADLFFQFISQRYERRSIIITTNLTYSEWDKVFLDATTTAAAVDRIIHKSETFNIHAPSWRREEAEKRMRKTA